MSPQARACAGMAGGTSRGEGEGNTGDTVQTYVSTGGGKNNTTGRHLLLWQAAPRGNRQRAAAGSRRQAAAQAHACAEAALQAECGAGRPQKAPPALARGRGLARPHAPAGHRARASNMLQQKRETTGSGVKPRPQHQARASGCRGIAAARSDHAVFLSMRSLMKNSARNTGAIQLHTATAAFIAVGMLSMIWVAT